MPVLKKYAKRLGERRKETYVENSIAELEKLVNMQNEIINTLAEKVGYTLEELGITEAGSRVYGYEKNEDKTSPNGDAFNPIRYVVGMTVSASLWYTDGTYIWEAIASGVPDNFLDQNFFDIVGF